MRRVMILLGCLTLAASVALAGPSEVKFLEAVDKHNTRKVERYLDEGVPEDWLREGLRRSMRRGDTSFIELFTRHIEPDEAMMLQALGMEHQPVIFELLVKAGGRFTRPESLWQPIRGRREKQVLRMLEAGRGLEQPGRTVGLRKVASTDGTITLEKYEEPRGMTALYLAVEYGMKNVVDRLLAAGANPGYVVTTPGTAKGVDLAGMEIGERVEVDSKASFKPPKRSTPLLVSYWKKDFETAEKLLAADAPIAVAGGGDELDACAVAYNNSRGRWGDPFVLKLCPDVKLNKAASNGDLETVKAALDDGRDPNLIGRSSWGLIHNAASGGQHEIVKLLLARGAAVDLRSREIGYTALSLAAGEGHLPIVETLLAAGSDPNVKNANGETPLLRTTSLEIVRALADAGADLHATDRYGLNAMVLANRIGMLDIVDFLRSRGVEYGPGFSEKPGKHRPYDRSPAQGRAFTEGVLSAVDQGTVAIRGQLANNAIDSIACKLTDVSRDAHYFHAPSLTKGKRLPQERPLVTLEDDDLRPYIGSIVRLRASRGICTGLMLPTARKPDTATPEQLAALMKTTEIKGDVFDIITKGRASMVFRGKLKSFSDDVALVTLDNNLPVRCKLTHRTQGILYGGAFFDRAMMGEKPDVSEMMTEQKIRARIGNRVLIGPGTGRCEWFEFLDNRSPAG